MKIAIIINTHRLPEELSKQLNGKELTEKYHINYDLFLTEPQEIGSLLDSLNHQSYNAYIIGGGDGTVRTVSEKLMSHDIPVAILPLGTFNLLAKTLEHPKDIDAIFAMIKNNKTKKIDLAEVNGQIIINHAWIGFYYYMLKVREKHKEILGKNKLLKMIFNALNLFKVLPIYRLEVKIDNNILRYNTCLVYVGNNESHTNLLDFGERKSLTSGLLAITILNCQTRWQLFLCMLSILTGNFSNSKYVTEFSTDSLSITAKSSLINVVIDGELFKLEIPLHFINHPKSLMVFTP